MEVVAILRRLWRRRLAVLAGAVLALALGVAAGRSEPATSGSAWTRMTLDTEPSQVVARAPAGAETLGWRAMLLGALTLTDAFRDELAATAGIPRDQLTVAEPALDVPAIPTALPRRVAETTAPATPYVLSVTSNESLSTLLLSTAAPDRAAAVRLAEAATTVLAAEGSPRRQGAQPYVIRPSAAIESDTRRSGGGRSTAAAAVLVVFTLWCGAVVLAPARRRRPVASPPRGAPQAG